MPTIVYNNLPFDQRFVDGSAHNEAFGRFLTVWSQIEATYCFIGQALTDTEPFVMSALIDKARTREVLEILIALTEESDAAQSAELRLALDETQKLSVTRNKLIHAGWGLYNGEEARFSHDLNRSDLHEITQGTAKGVQKRNRLIFTVSDIRSKIEEALTLRDRLTSLLDTLPSKSQQRQDELMKLTRENLTLRLGLLQEQAHPPRSSPA